MSLTGTVVRLGASTEEFTRALDRAGTLLRELADSLEAVHARDIWRQAVAGYFVVLGLQAAYVVWRTW